jgi:hypothetical protein
MQLNHNKFISPNHFMVDEFRRFLSTNSVPKKPLMPIKSNLQIVVPSGDTMKDLGMLTSPKTI